MSAGVDTVLPAWVYDLVQAVVEHEEVHPKDGGTCLKPALDAVPAYVIRDARIIDAYKAQVAAGAKSVQEALPLTV